MIPASRNVIKVNFTADKSSTTSGVDGLLSSNNNEHEVAAADVTVIPNHPTLQYQVDKSIDACMIEEEEVEVERRSNGFTSNSNNTPCSIGTSGSGFDLTKRVDGTLLRAPSKVAAPMSDGAGGGGSEICLVCRDGKARTSRCVRCRSVLYCGPVCQKLHWPFHKKVCVKLKECSEKYSVRYQNNTLNSHSDSDGNTNASRIFNPYDNQVSIPWLNMSGKVGLNNVGNSCYLNSGLQCLSHIIPLSVYFMSDQYLPHLNIANRDGTGGVLAKVYSSLLRELWFGGNTAVDKLASMRLREQAQMDARGDNSVSSDGAGGVAQYALNTVYQSIKTLTTGGGGASVSNDADAEDSADADSHDNNAMSVDGSNTTSSSVDGLGRQKIPSTASVTPSASSISPLELKKVLGNINEDYRGFVQQDAHDCIETLLDRLHEDVNQVEIPKPYVPNCDDGDGSNDHTVAKKSYENHLKRNNSKIDDVMGGQLRSQLTCNVCGHVSVSFEFTRCLSLAIPRSSTRLIRVIVPPVVNCYHHQQQQQQQSGGGSNSGSSDHSYIMPRPKMYAMKVGRSNTTILNVREILSNVIVATQQLSNPVVAASGDACSRLLQKYSEVDSSHHNHAAVTSDDFMLMELHGSKPRRCHPIAPIAPAPIAPAPAAASDTCFVYDQDEKEEEEGEAAHRPAATAPTTATASSSSSSSGLRARMHTVSRLLSNDSMLVSTLRAEDKEFLACSTLPSAALSSTNRGDFVFILQRTLITTTTTAGGKCYETHPLLQREACATAAAVAATATATGGDNKQVRFSSDISLGLGAQNITTTTTTSAAAAAAISSSTASKCSGLTTVVQLVGVPTICYIDLSWSCARVRYTLWVQFARRFFFRNLLEASGIQVPTAAQTAETEAAVAAKMKTMLKNVKVHAAIANSLPIRVVDQFGCGMAVSGYNGRVTPKYAASSVDAGRFTVGSNPFAQAFGTVSSSRTTATAGPSETRVNYDDNDQKFGARLPINSDITLSEFLGDLSATDSIPFLSIDYCDSGTGTGDDVDTAVNTGMDAAWSWLRAVDLAEVEAVDVVISHSSDEGDEDEAEQEQEGQSLQESATATATAKRTADPMEKYIATAAVHARSNNTSNSSGDFNRGECNVTTHRILLPTAGGAGTGGSSKDSKRRYRSVVCAPGLSVLSLPALSPSATVTLEQCLSYYTQREKLDGDNAWYCGKCKKHQPAEKSVSLWKLPQVMMVTLKRFDFHHLQQPGHYNSIGMGGNMTYNQKIDTFVDFPVHSLDMQPFMSAQRRSRTRTFSNMCVGDIIGRKHSSHSGSSGVPSVATTPALSRTNTDTSSCDFHDSAVDADANVDAASLAAEIAAEQTEEELAATAAVLQARAHTKYDLFAVTNHYGRSGFGHYTAMARDWRYVGTSQDMDLDYEPETAFAPWYLYDDDSVQLIQQQHREPLPPPLPLPLPRPVVSVTGSAGQQQQQQYQHQLPIPGAGHQPPSTSDVDDLIKTNNAYVLFYRLRNEC